MTAANVAVLWALWSAAAAGRIDLGAFVVYAQCTVGHVAHRLRRPQLGARRRGGAGGRRHPSRAGDGRGRARWRRAARQAAGLPAREIRFRNVTFAYPQRRAGARRLRPHDPGRFVAGHRRTERRRQDDARQAAVPVLRSRRPAPSRSTASTCARWTWRRGDRASPPCSRTSCASSCRCATTSRRPERPTRRVTARAGGRGRRRARQPRHRAGARLRRRHRSVGRPVAAGRAGPGALRGDDGRRGRAARRTDRAARRPRRSRDLRAAADRHPPLHHDPHLAPLLDGAPGRSDLRPRERARSSSWDRTTS